MAYSIPNFNLTANVWHWGTPITSPPDIVLLVQLRYPGRRNTGQDSSHKLAYLWTVLAPAFSDFRDWQNAASPDIFEVPAGTGRYYQAELVDDVAKGFPNEYRIAVVSKIRIWPVPIP